MATGKGLIYADSAQESVEYLKRHLIVGDSDFLRGYLQGVEALAEGLAKLPPVDAVKVVRCKDCRHTFICNCVSCRQSVSYYCGKYGKHMMPDDFCSYGERKDGDMNV